MRTDGGTGTERSPDDPLASTVPVHPYRLGSAADGIFSRLGVDVAALPAGDSRRPLLRFCVDWSEQRHHLAGALGAGVLGRMLAADWVRRAAEPSRGRAHPGRPSGADRRPRRRLRVGVDLGGSVRLPAVVQERVAHRGAGQIRHAGCVEVEQLAPPPRTRG